MGAMSPTKQSKITKYKLEEDVINLRKMGLSYMDIASELNNSGKVPDDDPIDKYVVARFLEKVPQVTKELVQNEKKRLLEVVNTNFDIYNEVNELFAKTKKMLDNLEENAIKGSGKIDPYRFKAISSEMRETLKFMTEIHREINDYNNVRKFMEIVITVLQEEAPEKIPIIAEKLKITQGTQWFAEMMKGDRDEWY